ncbi:DUF6161 domain-containing protein [Tenacibaculum ascidiaceicola]|uniref:DUF6161 domain-containing protein n=1 Tax=Tenacibaculum ascidiaceicola TaxID=1699411 RepID=UPI0039E9013D
MTNKQVNDLIEKNESSDFLKKVEVNINLQKVNISTKLTGLFELFIYVRKQRNGWNKIETEIPTNLTVSIDYFNKFLDNIETLLGKENAENSWYNLIENPFLTSGRYSQFSMSNIFTYDSPITSFLINVNIFGSECFNGAYDYIYDNINNNKIKNKLYYKGIQKAYEFEDQDPDKKTSRVRNERSNLSRLRNDFRQLFINAEKSFFEKIENQENQFEKQKKEILKWFEKSQIKEDDRFNKSIDNFKNQQLKNLDKIGELESLYSNKLMLSKPAEYWDERAQKLKKEASLWIKSLSLSIILALTILLLIIFKISDNTIIELFSNVGSGIKWSIVFISIISLLAFGIKIFSKLTFSSYHLVRDAEERKQLVYVYLSLLNENAISENERIIILQSLFSRSETGLLKDDSSPTMPSTSLLEKVISKSN